MHFLHVRFCSVSVPETELWLTCSVLFGQNGKTPLRLVTTFQYGQNSRFYHESYWVFLPSSKNTPLGICHRNLGTSKNKVLNKFYKNQITSKFCFDIFWYQCETLQLWNCLLSPLCTHILPPELKSINANSKKTSEILLPPIGHSLLKYVWSTF